MPALEFDVPELQSVSMAVAGKRYLDCKTAEDKWYLSPSLRPYSFEAHHMSTYPNPYPFQMRQ
jgi:hypothetical protein